MSDWHAHCQAGASMCRSVARGSTALVVIAMISLSCREPDPDDGPFPTDYERAWTEARDGCTLSHDHELRYIRVFANDGALGPYTQQDAPYPVGAALLKAEYDDPECTELLSFVLMEKLEAGTTPTEEHDWTWRRFDAQRREVFDRRAIPTTCIDCHAWHCEEPPYGWDYTCPPGSIEPTPR
ncbi:cytochrome P460 family protein [Sandaracinus amylolyticus]|uniref:cytochrome P460 family protein n=1 Tax=Sandaracinus amylolyticus TaxID=927083 RepID=UPI0014700A6E|nr:cytochrome P460 family protein [Sandaracinus amylolyticus]